MFPLIHIKPFGALFHANPAQKRLNLDLAAEAPAQVRAPLLLKLEPWRAVWFLTASGV